jgi:NitT/TauT family transport system substrate-binding protein
MRNQASPLTRVGAAVVLGLVAVLLAACGSSSSSSASKVAGGSGSGKSLTPVTFRTGFGFGPWDAGYAVALHNGYYKAAGLDVKILPGLGSSSNVQVIAHQQATFSNVGGSIDAIAVSKGAPVKAVATFFELGGNGVATVPSIKSVSQMQGHTFVGEAFDFGTLLFPVFQQAVGLHGIPVVSVASSAIPTVLERGRAQMMTAAGWAEVPELQADGVKFNFFPYANYGLNLIGPAITVNTSTLKQNPAMVKAFVDATAKGFQFVYSNPAQAATITHEVWPTTLMKYDVAVTRALQAYAQSAATKSKNLGWMAPSDWQHTVNVLVKLKQVPPTLNPTTVYTNVVPPTG